MVFSEVEKTGKAAHIVVTTATKEGSTQRILERKIPLITIKSIAMSTLRDDWMVSDCFHTSDVGQRSTVQALNVNISEEGDPVFSCYFKTELAATLLQLTSAGINFVVTPMCVVLISFEILL